MQYADDLYAKLCKFANVCNKLITNNIFIEGVDFSVWHSLKKNYATSPRADPTSIASKTQSLLAIQKESTKHAYTGDQNANPKQYGKQS